MFLNNTKNEYTCEDITFSRTTHVVCDNECEAERNVQQPVKILHHSSKKKNVTSHCRENVKGIVRTSCLLSAVKDD